MRTKELRAFFSGRVQGVGFRWQTKRCLEDLELKGYVRNLVDNRVELRVQGREDLVIEAIARVRRVLADYITAVEVEDQNLSEGLGSFSILGP